MKSLKQLSVNFFEQFVVDLRPGWPGRYTEFHVTPFKLCKDWKYKSVPKIEWSCNMTENYIGLSSRLCILTPWLDGFMDWCINTPIYFSSSTIFRSDPTMYCLCFGFCSPNMHNLALLNAEFHAHSSAYATRLSRHSWLKDLSVLICENCLTKLTVISKFKSNLYEFSN